MSGAAVEVDWAPLDRAMRQLSDGIDEGARREARDAANAAAAAIRPRVPVLTGALQSTVEVNDLPDGGEVSYGGGLPYAAYIERRSHAVEEGVAVASDQYERAALEMARREVRKL